MVQRRGWGTCLQWDWLNLTGRLREGRAKLTPSVLRILWRGAWKGHSPWVATVDMTMRLFILSNHKAVQLLDRLIQSTMCYHRREIVELPQPNVLLEKRDCGTISWNELWHRIEDKTDVAARVHKLDFNFFIFEHFLTISVLRNTE